MLFVVTPSAFADRNERSPRSDIRWRFRCVRTCGTVLRLSAHPLPLWLALRYAAIQKGRPCRCEGGNGRDDRVDQAGSAGAHAAALQPASGHRAGCVRAKAGGSSVTRAAGVPATARGRARRRSELSHRHNAITFATGSVLGENVVTVEYKVNYLRPAQGERLLAAAIVESSGRQLAVCRCEVHSIEGENKSLCR